MKKKFHKKKRYIIPCILVVILIAARIYLPYKVKSYVNKVLADIPGYYGQIKDIDIALIRGAYTIDGLYLNKVNAGTQVPFLNFPITDISIEWKSIFKGKIVSEIIMDNPEIIYVLEDQKKNSTEGKANINDWTKALTDLVPLEINHFEIHDGTFAFVKLKSDPNVDLQINKVELNIDNLRNVIERKRVLPSTINATGVSIGGGKMNIDGGLNIIKKIPDANINLSLENVDVTALNSFTNHYASLDFESGSFSFFSEIAIADGFLKGYLKPLLTNSKLIGSNDGFLEILWEGLTGFFKFILKNQKTDTLATVIPLEGDLNNVESKIIPTILNIFENAWIQAFKKGVDDSIEFDDAFKENKSTSKKRGK